MPVAAARASTIEFGAITGVPGDSSRSWMNTVHGSFTDYALFSLVRASNIVASITNSYASSELFISDLTLSLYSGSVIGSGDLLGTATSVNPNAPPSSQTVDLVSLARSAGSYYLAVSGTTTDSPSYGGSLSVMVSTVPLPASAPLFGAALLAVGVAGYAAKRGKGAATART